MPLESYLLQQILFGILLPAIVCGFSFLLLKNFLKQNTFVVSIALGYMVAHLSLTTFRSPPMSVQQWIPFLILVVLVLTLLEQVLPLLKISSWFRWVPRLVLLNLWLFQIFKSYLQDSLLRPARWEFTDALLHFAVISMVVFVFWRSLEHITEQSKDGQQTLDQRTVIFLTLIILATTTAVNIALAHSLVTAQLTGGLTSVMAAALVASWLRKDVVLTKSALPVIVILFTAFLLNATYCASLPWYVTLAIACSPVLIVLINKTRKTNSSLRNQGARAFQYISQIAPILIISIICVYTTFKVT